MVEAPKVDSGEARFQRWREAMTRYGKASNALHRARVAMAKAEREYQGAAAVLADADRMLNPPLPGVGEPAPESPA